MITLASAKRMPGAGMPRSSALETASAAAFVWSDAQAGARGHRARLEPLVLLGGLMGAADGMMVFAATIMVFVVLSDRPLAPHSAFVTGALASLMMVNGVSLSGGYKARVTDSFIKQTGLALRTWSVMFVLLVGLAYATATATEFSPDLATIWFGSVSIGLAAIRLCCNAQLRIWRRRGRLASTIAIVDLAHGATEMARRLARTRSSDVRLVGIFRDDEENGRSGIDTLISLSRLFRIDEIFVLVAADSTGETGRLPEILRALGTIPANVRLCPHLPEVEQAMVRDGCLVHDCPVLTVHRRPMGTWSGIVKRIEDVVIGIIALVFMLPVMATIAAAIKLDSPGPILFRQARLGFNNNVISVLKFRSMTHQTAPETFVQARRNDQRVTRVGRILRRTSLDELPQIFNVLRGDMSLVGPRPHAVAHNEEFAGTIDVYLSRHRVQPGITGWAQVNGLRGETDTLMKMQQRVEHDLQYIDTWSVWLDLKIIVRTAVSMLFDRRAY